MSPEVVVEVWCPTHEQVDEDRLEELAATPSPSSLDDEPASNGRVAGTGNADPARDWSEAPNRLGVRDIRAGEDPEGSLELRMECLAAHTTSVAEKWSRVCRGMEHKL
jgi:hypothetical protein